MKKQLYLALTALAISSFTLPSHASSGTQYYPTYTDGVTNVYTYNQFKQFEINTKVGYITDIQLRPNELLQKIATGNSSQWSVDQDVVGGIQHIYIKPLASGLKTNFIINTDKRSYRLLVNSTDSTEYSVAFIFPDEDAADIKAEKAAKKASMQAAKEKELEVSNRVISTNYKVKKNHHVASHYVPKAVFDDGLKTYIELPDNVQDNFPTLYAYDRHQKNKIQLVNYRLKGNVLEVDKILPSMKLTFNQNSYLMIEKQELKDSIPAASTIRLNPANVNELLQELHAPNDSMVTFKDTYQLKSERERKARIDEQKQFIKDTQQQEGVNAEAAPLTNEALDQMIAKLESDIANVTTNATSSSSPQDTQHLSLDNPSNWHPWLQPSSDAIDKN